MAVGDDGGGSGCAGATSADSDASIGGCQRWTSVCLRVVGCMCRLQCAHRTRGPQTTNGTSRRHALARSLTVGQRTAHSRDRSPSLPLVDATALHCATLRFPTLPLESGSPWLCDESVWSSNQRASQSAGWSALTAIGPKASKAGHAPRTRRRRRIGTKFNHQTSTYTINTK